LSVAANTNRDRIGMAAVGSSPVISAAGRTGDALAAYLDHQPSAGLLR
jgi:hypothetical protein